MKRTFIAIKIPFSKQTLELIHDIKLALKDERIKWVDYWNIHITLFFLGDTEEHLINEIEIKLMNTLKGFKSFELKCKGIGVFKDLHNPKVVWFGIKKSEVLTSLKNKVDEILGSCGFNIEDRVFSPHITIGKIRYLKNKDHLKTIVEKYRESDIQDTMVNEIIFYESTLTPKGPIYNVLRKIPLS